MNLFLGDANSPYAVGGFRQIYELIKLVIQKLNNTRSVCTNLPQQFCLFSTETRFRRYIWAFSGNYCSQHTTSLNFMQFISSQMWIIWYYQCSRPPHSTETASHSAQSCGKEMTHRSRKWSDKKVQQSVKHILYCMVPATLIRDFKFLTKLNNTDIIPPSVNTLPIPPELGTSIIIHVSASIKRRRWR